MNFTNNSFVGRAGRTGISLSFLTRSDWGVARELINILKEAGQEVPEKLQDMAERFENRKPREGGRGRGFRGSSRGLEMFRERKRLEN